MIDFDRTKDVELLRTVAKVQDTELRRVHEKLAEMRAEISKLKKLSPEEAELQLALLEKELNEGYKRTVSSGSERKPRPKDPKPKKSKKGHGPTPQPELPVETVVHELGRLLCSLQHGLT